LQNSTIRNVLSNAENALWVAGRNVGTRQSVDVVSPAQDA
jgi:hypothetical protein